MVRIFADYEKFLPIQTRRVRKKKYFEPAKQFPEFTKEDVEVFIEAFREYDTDQSGSIDARELDVAFTRMGQGCSPEKLKQIIDEVDDNKNGTVEWPGFLKIMRNMYAAKFDDKYPTSTTTTSTQQTIVPTPTKSSTNNGIPPTKMQSSPSKSSTTPVKNTANNTPTKSTTTTSTPPKSPSTPPKSPSTPVKSTSSSTSTTSTTSSTQPPTKSFGQTKPSTSTTNSTPSSSTLSSHRGPQGGCASCGKTVYPIEEIRAMEQTFHKGCFRCQEEGCGILLNLKTFKGTSGKIYCSKHVPSSKPTQTPVSGSLATLNATSAPKLQKAQGIKKNERMTFAPGELKPIDGEQQ